MIMMELNRKTKHMYMFIIACLLFLIYLIFLGFGVSNLSKILDHFKHDASEGGNNFLQDEDQHYYTSDKEVKRLISKYNKEERIFNLDLYGIMALDAPVFVIFVDKYKTNFDFLLGSLYNVEGIEDALIIFSHSFFDMKLNAIIETITFARVLQIYYPYSLQVFSPKFPGSQENCSYNREEDALKHSNHTKDNLNINIECLQYSNRLLTQKKHFWWWTMNYVFENLSHTKRHKGVFTFLEDDLFLMQDFIYMTLQMKNISKFIYQCDFIALATAGKYPDFTENDIDGVDVKTWDPTEHTSVLAFDSDVWKNIVPHYEHFCNFEDHSWSRTLFDLSLHKKDGRFKVISTIVPRAYKTSAFNKGPKKYSTLNIINTVARIIEIQNVHENIFFPTQLEVFIDLDLERDLVKHYVQNNKSWSNSRDAELCTNITELIAKKETFDLTSEYVDENGSD